MSSIKQIKQGLVTVLTPETPLLGDSSESLREKIQLCLEVGECHLVLDFQRVTYVDSQALEMLLAGSRLARHKGGALKIAQVNEVCQDVFIATRTRHVLELYPDIPNAVRSFL